MEIFLVDPVGVEERMERKDCYYLRQQAQRMSQFGDEYQKLSVEHITFEIPTIYSHGQVGVSRRLYGFESGFWRVKSEQEILTWENIGDILICETGCDP